MMNVLPSLLVLGLAAVAAAMLVRTRWSPPGNEVARRAAANALTVAVVIQAIHFVEEAATGFNVRLAELLGLPAMAFSFFVGFNVLWLGIWTASVPGLRSARPFAFFAAWFLAIAGCFNGIAHPLLAIASGRYFPGLVSSPFAAFASAWLWMRLRHATRPRPVGLVPDR